MDETTNVIENPNLSEVSDNETTAAPAFVCDCIEWVRPVCAGLSFYKEHKGKHYCVLHCPIKEKSAEFKVVFDKKLAAEDFNFRGVWFPDEMDFGEFIFSADADFSYATFTEDVVFGAATFSANADFSAAVFGAKAYFIVAAFGANADFSGATFSADAYFSGAKFKGSLNFAGSANNAVFLDESSLNFEYVEIEKPDRVSFHTLTLRPHWFVNVDPRKFEFVNVTWITNDIDKEIENLKDKGIDHPHRLLSIACRHLAVNAEEYHRYEDGMRFRYWAMDVRRRERFKGFAFWSISWWYWAASGYGERVFRAFIALLGIWFLFALLYTQVGFVQWEPRVTNASEAAVAERDTVGHPLPYTRAFTYSLAVMSLQKPEPKPATNTAQALVVLQTILGPLQAALLALAIRRRFMR